MNVNTSIWGEPYTEYDTMNNRTGASDLTDPDFEDFPPFVKNDMRTNGVSNAFLSNETLYIGYLNNPTQFDFLKPMDFSIAYCACKNPDLGLNNIGIPIPSQYDPYQSDIAPANAFRFKTKPNVPQPIVFLNSYGFMHDLTTTVSVGQFSNPYYMQSVLLSAQTKYVPNGNNNNGNTDTQAHINSSNRNLFFSYWRDFGLRCLFGTIMVTYFDGTYNATTGVPQNVDTKSLHWFESQTDAFKSYHRILGAFLRINFRRSTTGLYNNTTPQSQCFIADFSGNLFADESVWGIQYPLQQWQPCSAYVRNTSSYLPLFGPANLGQTINTRTGYVSWVSQQSSGGTAQYSNLLLGINTELPFLSYGHGLATNDTGRRSYWIEMDYTSESAEYIRKCAAAYGLFFTDGESNETGYSDLYAAGHDEDRWTNTNMCLGVVDDEGYTDGTYTRGSGNEDANNFLWKTASESKYDPDRPPPSPENRYDTQTVFNSIGDLATMTRRYVLRGTEVLQLGSALWSISEALTDSGTDFSELTPKVIDQFLTNNPIDCIISLQRYPMTIPAVGTSTVKLGKTDTGIACKPMERTAFFYLFTGSVINPKFGDSFLDYNPYTKMELYVPFCGTMQLNPADIIGRQLNVQLVVDFTTGTCTGFIMSDDLVIETVNGNIAIDIPVTGIQAATVASQLNNAIANKSNKTLEAQSASLGNVSLGGLFRLATDPVKALKSAEIAENEETRAEYDLTHQNAPIHVIGAASAVGGWAIDLQCRLIIYYPSGDVIRTGQPPEWNSQQLAMYGRTTGFACCIEGSIDSMDTGLVIGTSPDLNGMVTNVQGYPATAAELDMIRAAISEGVIL